MIKKETFIQQLEQLVAIPSLSGNQETNQKILDLIQSLTHPNVTQQRIKNNGTEILLLSTANNSASTSFLQPAVGYLVHADVVAAKPELWQMQHENNKLLGRGVSDMKYAIPIGLALLSEQLAITQKNKTEITVAITTDEELGGFDGAKYLAEEIGFQPKCLIVPDGGDNWQFVEKEKGFVRIELHTYGKSAHGSQPWNGKNAISSLVKVLTAIDSYFEKNNSKKAWNTTCNIGVIQGGASVNQVCNHASAMLDIRHTEATTKEAIQKEIELIAKKANVEIEIRLNTYGHSRYTPHTHPVAQSFISVMQKHAPKKIEITKSYGASDARHFSIYNEIPVLMMKPNGGDIHQDTEWIDVEECISFAKGLSEFVKTLS